MTRQIVIPRQIVPERKYRVLEGSKLAEYKDSIQRYSGRFREVLEGNGNPLRVVDDEFAGSSVPIILHLIQTGLIGSGRVSTRDDLENPLVRGLNLLGIFVEGGLALRSANDTVEGNTPIATALVEDLRARGIDLGRGVLIPYFALAIKENPNSAYGFDLNLNDKATRENVLDLEQFKWNGTRDNGVARACLCDGRIWYSFGGHLADSSDCGRVVVVDEERIVA